MINYSIVMRAVNANLFAINAAKSRIKAAKKEGREPDQADLDLVATEVQNAFAVAQYNDVMNIDKFSKHIASHGCVYSHADINAMLTMAVDCTHEMLLEGKKICLGDLGCFSLNLTSRGAESAEKFTSQNITGVTVVWEPGPQFKNLLAEAEFNLVASRNAQAAVIKAIKAGETVVDLSHSDEKDAPSDETPDVDNGGGGSTANTQSGGGSQTPGGNNTQNGSENQGTQNPPTGGEQTGEGSDGAMGE